jgi:hypothetical protein
MADFDGSAAGTFSPNFPYHQQQLFALISTLVAPQARVAPERLCRLIVDCDLSWSRLQTHEGKSWLYLSEPAAVRRIADCLFLTGA